MSFELDIIRSCVHESETKASTIEAQDVKKIDGDEVKTINRKAKQCKEEKKPSLDRSLYTFIHVIINFQRNDRII